MPKTYHHVRSPRTAVQLSGVCHKPSKHRDQGPVGTLFVSARRRLENVGLLVLCTANGLRILRGSDDNEPIFPSEALFPWRRLMMLLKFLGEVPAAVVGLLLLELALTRHLQDET